MFAENAKQRKNQLALVFMPRLAVPKLVSLSHLEQNRKANLFTCLQYLMSSSQ
jgi:hypothetical protein